MDNLLERYKHYKDFGVPLRFYDDETCVTLELLIEMIISVINNKKDK
jgi:hypothetical protein